MIINITVTDSVACFGFQTFYGQQQQTAMAGIWVNPRLYDLGDHYVEMPVFRKGPGQWVGETFVKYLTRVCL